MSVDCSLVNIKKVLEKKCHVKNSDTLIEWLKEVQAVIKYFKENDKIKSEVETMRDALVDFSQYAITDKSVRAWSDIIYEFTEDKNNKIIFGTETIKNTFINISKYVTTAETVRSWSDAIINITYKNNILFRSKEMENSIINISCYATTPISVMEWSKVIWNLTINSNDDLFKSQNIINALKNRSVYATTIDSIQQLCNCFRYIHTNKYNDQILTDLEEIKMYQMGQFHLCHQIKDSIIIMGMCTAIYIIGDIGYRLMNNK
jgi:hypothetical protein